MEFFVESNALLNKVTDPDKLRGRVPGFETSMEAAADLRDYYRQTGTQGDLYNKGFKHVATILGPVMAVAEILDQEFLNRNGKKDFYAWLDTHPQYLAYDRRRGRIDHNHLRNGIVAPGLPALAPVSPSLQFVEGEV